MELMCNKELSMSQVFESLVKVREAPYVERLNYFKHYESLESINDQTLSREALETKLLKSLGIKAEEVAHMGLCTSEEG